MQMRDFDMALYNRADDYAGLEHRWHLTDFAFLEGRGRKRPFLGKIRGAFHTLAQISKIRVQVTFEMREPVVSNK